MKTTKYLLQSGALALSLLATSVMAAVSADEAANGHAKLRHAKEGTDDATNDRAYLCARNFSSP